MAYAAGSVFAIRMNGGLMGPDGRARGKGGMGMVEVHRGKMTAEIEGEFVVLIIGARLHHFWMIHRWVPVALAMKRMLRELEAHPETGFLGYEVWGIFRPVLVQYWRSFDALEAYARAKERHHLPAWVEYNRKIQANAAIGIWHETYRIAPGAHECIYTNMPAIGLGRASKLAPVGARGESARERLATAGTD
jgi:hypothetical protein